MKKAIIIFLIVTFLGLALFIFGLPKGNYDFAMCGWGIVLFCLGSFICAVLSGTKLTSFFNWQASSAATGCLLFPVYMLVYPVMGILLCLSGWAFGIKKLAELSKK